MKLENVKVGMRVKVKSKHVVPEGQGQASLESLGQTGTVLRVDLNDAFDLSVRLQMDSVKPKWSGTNIDWMSHKQIKQLDKPDKVFIPKIGDSVYVTSKALGSGVPERTVESVVTWMGYGYTCTDGKYWLASSPDYYRKPKEGDRINSARLTKDTIKVGMKVRTLEGTLTARPAGSTEFTVTRVWSGGDTVDLSYKRYDGSKGTQSDRIKYLTKSW